MTTMMMDTSTVQPQAILSTPERDSGDFLVSAAP